LPVSPDEKEYLQTHVCNDVAERCGDAPPEWSTDERFDSRTYKNHDDGHRKGHDEGK
jgi:hypothetical protein